jgi:hypothetical protein
VDIAVWEGPTPTSDDEAAKTFEELYDRYIESDADAPPSQRITEYVRALLERYPDLDELDDDAVDDSPWADSPLMGNARGPFIYFSLVANEAANEAWQHAVTTARAMGLVCFDPQSGTLTA